MNKVYIETLGCKVNQYESAAILDSLMKNAYESCKDIKEADIYIINTCTVTNRTDFKSRNLIRKALEFKKEDPNKIVIVTGCYAQREKEQALNLGEIDAIVDNNSKDKISEIIEELKLRRKPFVNDTYFKDQIEFETFTELASSTMSDKSRVFIKIQDGCNFYCAYCAVPYARGNPRSRRPKSIISQINEMLDKGYKEFVLAGINQGLYGIDFSENYDLADLIQDICNIPKYKKIRISSVEPQLFSDKLIEVISRNEQVCPHLHIPMQSGSDQLLQAMGRKYDTAFFRNLIKKFQEKVPNLALGFDVIVGLPGETETLFNETYHLLKELDFCYLHVFIYSKRNGTRAAKMPNQVHGTEAKNRSAKLIELSKEKTLKYSDKLANNQELLRVIVEGFEDNYYYGTSDHFVKCLFKADHLEKGQLCLVKAKQTEQDYLLGEYLMNEG